MRKRLLALVSAVGIAAVGSVASAQISPVEPDAAETNIYRITGPFQMVGTPFTSDASVLYSNTTETSSRFNPGTGGTASVPGVQQDITFDDIAIPNARLGGANAVNVTKVTVGIRRADVAVREGAGNSYPGRILVVVNERGRWPAPAAACDGSPDTEAGKLSDAQHQASLPALVV